MNSTSSQKYGYAPDAVEEKVAESEKFRDIYDFYRLVKVRQHAERYQHAGAKKDKKLRKKLREPLRIGEKGLALAECLKKKDAPGNLYKSTNENISFSNVKKMPYKQHMKETYNFKINKINQSKCIEFFDINLKKRRLRYVYSPNKE